MHIVIFAQLMHMQCVFCLHVRQPTNRAGCGTIAFRLRGAVHAMQNYYVFMEFAGNTSLHSILRARCTGFRSQLFAKSRREKKCQESGSNRLILTHSFLFCLEDQHATVSHGSSRPRAAPPRKFKESPSLKHRGTLLCSFGGPVFADGLRCEFSTATGTTKWDSIRTWLAQSSISCLIQLGCGSKCLGPIMS